jgi:hypothetical protein
MLIMPRTIGVPDGDFAGLAGGELDAGVEPAAPLLVDALEQAASAARSRADATAADTDLSADGR